MDEDKTFPQDGVGRNDYIFCHRTKDIEVRVGIEPSPDGEEVENAEAWAELTRLLNKGEWTAAAEKQTQDDWDLDEVFGV